MTDRHSRLFALLAWLLLLPAALGEEVEVIVDGAPIKVEDTVLGSAKQGDRMRVLRRSGPWVAVIWNTGSREQRGWVFAAQVRTIVDPEINEKSPAPPEFDPIKVSVRDTQALPRNPPAIFLEMTILNDGSEMISYDAARITLKADGMDLRSLPREEACTESPFYVPFRTTTNDGTLTHAMLSQVRYLQTGQLVPGTRVSGWLAFAIPQDLWGNLNSPLAARPTGWFLEVPLDRQVVSLDLRALEVEAINAKVRPSVADASVPVLEVGSRVNLINLDRLVTELERLFAAEQGFVLSLTTPSCLIDAPSGTAIGRVLQSHLRPRAIRPVAYSGGVSGDWGPLRLTPFSASEMTAVLVVLGQRADGREVLLQRASDPVAEVRVTAARYLADYLDDPRVVTSLCQAMRDEVTAVRLEALRSLTAGLGGLPSEQYFTAGPVPMAPVATLLTLDGDLLDIVLAAAHDPDVDVRALAVANLIRSSDQRATAAIVRALGDPAEYVQLSAIRSAAQHPADVVAPPLIAKLTSQQGYSVQVPICQVLGRLKCDAAMPVLLELQERPDRSLAAAAIDALKELEVLSPLDAALRKLEISQSLSAGDTSVLVESTDARVVPKLLDALNSQNSEFVATAAVVLGRRCEDSAVQPLIRVIESYSRNLPAEVPLALGRIGDKRAIEPLEKALAQQPYLYEIVAGLAMLDAPGAREKVIELLRHVAQRPEERGIALMQAVTQASGNEDNEFLMALLDQPGQTCGLAAKLLWEQGTPAVRTRLAKRVSAADYPSAESVIATLTGRYYAPRTLEEWERCSAEMRPIIRLLDELVLAVNPQTRNAASDALQWMEKAIGAAALQRLRTAANE